MLSFGKNSFNEYQKDAEMEQNVGFTKIDFAIFSTITGVGE